MPLTAAELFRLARKVETDIARLYEDLAGHLPADSPEGRFFRTMAAQEHTHADWVDQMAAEVNPDYVIDTLAPEEFAHILGTIADVHDEVMHESIQLADAVEIILHLENSTAEEFYIHIPETVPGLSKHWLEKMARSCLDHVKAVAEFRDTYVRAHQAGS